MGIGSSGAGVGSAPVGMVPPSFQFELGEGFNKSTDARNLKLWQYERFMKNVGRPFLGMLDTKEVFLWISSAIRVLGSMAC